MSAPDAAAPVIADLLSLVNAYRFDTEPGADGGLFESVLRSMESEDVVPAIRGLSGLVNALLEMNQLVTGMTPDEVLRMLHDRSA